MGKILLSEIKPAEERVRTELNLERLDELVESIKEMGRLIVPVKLRGNGDGYTIVYGHRRVEAARMAGLEVIEAIIEDMDDDELLTQALIENVVREDMAPLDIAKALNQIKEETGWTNAEVGAKFGMSHQTVSEYLALLKPEFQDILKDSGRTELTPQHLREAKAGTDDDKDAAKVLEKAAKEGLSKRQTRAVAEEYTRTKAFGGEAMAQRDILNKPFEQIVFGKELKQTATKTSGASKTEGQSTYWSWISSPNYEMIDDAIKTFTPFLAWMSVNKSHNTADGIAVLQTIERSLEITLGRVRGVIKEFEDETNKTI